LRKRSFILAVASLTAALAVSPIKAQELTSPSEWLDKLDREHDRLVSKSGQVHARGKVQVVDVGSGTITLITEEMQSPDKSIWMPAMRMVFHVTNRLCCKGFSREMLSNSRQQGCETPS
jgi:Cu/Ag efflux protein CusF